MNILAYSIMWVTGENRAVKDRHGAAMILIKHNCVLCYSLGISHNRMAALKVVITAVSQYWAILGTVIRGKRKGFGGAVPSRSWEGCISASSNGIDTCISEHSVMCRSCALCASFAAYRTALRRARSSCDSYA